MIVAVLKLSWAATPQATTQPTPTKQQSNTYSPLITSSQATQAPPTQAPTPSVESPKVIFEKAFSNLSFRRLANLVQAGDRLFVTEQVGWVMSFPSTVEPAKSTIFLDIQSRVSTARNEVGLVDKGGNYGWNTLRVGYCFSHEPNTTHLAHYLR